MAGFLYYQRPADVIWSEPENRWRFYKSANMCEEKQTPSQAITTTCCQMLGVLWKGRKSQSKGSMEGGETVVLPAKEEEEEKQESDRSRGWDGH